MQFVDVYLFEKKTDSKSLKWKEIEVTFDSNQIKKTTPYFEVEISLEEDLERMSSFKGELIRLKIITLDDDEIPSGYICYDLMNWGFSGKRMIVMNPKENVHTSTLPFN